MTTTMTSDLLSRPAATVRFDPEFLPFLRAVESVTHLPREFARKAFETGDGSVGDVIAQPLHDMGFDDDPAAVVVAVREAGGHKLRKRIADVERQLAEARSELASWEAFIDGNDDHQETQR